MNVRKKISFNECSRIWAFIAFAIVLLIKVILNLNIPCMRSLPDEMGAVAFAAKTAGYDWSYVLTHPAMYYGSGTFFLFTPFFLLIKDPIILYQFLLGVGALLHALSAYIACRITQKFFEGIPSYHVVIIGVICGFFSPTRTSNIDNEPMLILLCWIIVYLIMSLQNSKGKNEKRVLSFLLAFTLAFSYLSHTRALIYTILVILLIIIYRILTKKKLVDYLFFGGSMLSFFVLAIILVEKLQDILFTGTLMDKVMNTPSEVASKTIDNFLDVFSPVGIQSFFDLLFSNLWIIFVFSLGILPFIAWYTLIKTKNILLKRFRERQVIEKTDCYFPTLFCVLGVGISLLGLCVVWLVSAKGVHINEENLSRGHFYLRYYGNYFGPLILLFLLQFRENMNWDRTNKFAMSFNFTTLLVGIVYCMISFLGITSIRYQYNLDWFYYFAPFSGMLNSWPNTIQTLSYFACATLISIIICIIVFKGLTKGKVTYVLILIMIIQIYQYTYGVLRFDSPFSKSENYYQTANTSYEINEKDDRIFANISQIFYNNKVYGSQYIMQFMLPNHQIITDLSLVDEDKDTIIISNEIIEDLEEDGFYEVQLDENEFFYTNSISRRNIVNKYDMKNETKGYE